MAYLTLIARGLPGSGKSTFFNKLSELSRRSVFICSADKYRYNEEGEYVFKVEDNKRCHQWCLMDFLARLHSPSILVIDNTNVNFLDFYHYYAVSEAYERETFVVNFECTVEESIARNVHGVPESTIRRMSAKLQTPLPDFVKVLKGEEETLRKFVESS